MGVFQREHVHLTALLELSWEALKIYQIKIKIFFISKLGPYGPNHGLALYHLRSPTAL